MSSKLDYEWRLREQMATRGMFSTTELRPRLAERGIELSASQVYRLVVDKPERLSLRVLMALIDILGCRMEDLIAPAASNQLRKASGGGRSVRRSKGDPSNETGLGELRPKRARIISDKPRSSE